MLMQTVRIEARDDVFVIHFGTEASRISAYTLASVLVGFADAAREANASINPGHDVQIVVEALQPGSFRATVRAIYHSTRNLFSADTAKAVALGVLSSFIYQHTLQPDTQIEITTSSDEVVIQQGDTRVVVPRNVYDALSQVQKNERFLKGVSTAMTALEEDPQVSSIGFAPVSDDSPTPLQIPRERFGVLIGSLEPPEEQIREIIEVQKLQIIRAILDRSKRRWEFAWRGIKISAPVTDERFYDQFFQRSITVAPGDVFEVRLLIRQRRDPALNVFLNDSYEVVEVLQHIPSTSDQLSMD
ncbi:MAG TPA: hypothetical protein VHO25_24620 [Polyangiaceae bacterium]|nr:hypothetical protein [Polyangiaceae bacterium]